MLRIPTDRPPTHPGAMLREEFLEPLGISQTELAEWIGASYARINELIHGKRGVTSDTALRLERAFGNGRAVLAPLAARLGSLSGEAFTVCQGDRPDQTPPGCCRATSQRLIGRLEAWREHCGATE